VNNELYIIFLFDVKETVAGLDGNNSGCRQMAAPSHTTV